MTGFSHSAWHFQCSSTLWHVSGFHSFFWLSNIPLHFDLNLLCYSFTEVHFHYFQVWGIMDNAVIHSCYAYRVLISLGFLSIVCWILNIISLCTLLLLPSGFLLLLYEFSEEGYHSLYLKHFKLLPALHSIYVARLALYSRSSCFSLLLSAGTVGLHWQAHFLMFLNLWWMDCPPACLGVVEFVLLMAGQTDSHDKNHVTYWATRICTEQK